MVNKRFSAFSRKSLLVRSVPILLAGCVLLYYIYLKTTIVHQQIFIIDHQSKYSNGSINGNEETIATGTFGDHNLLAKNGNVSSSNEKGLCPLVSPHLRGEFKPTHVIPESISNVEDELKMVEALPALGGSWQPNNCTARHHIAIIVPCHDRDEHLRALLRHLHPFLQRQQNSYGIFVVDQKEDGRPFNKAMIMNAGFAEVNKTGQFSCFIFHDVDLLPEDDRNLYSCADQPRHIGIAVDKLGYHLPYNTLIGGVVAFTKSQFERINGFSNLYWGWGGEDDDAAKRIMAANMKITRWPKYARYTMLVHKRRHINPQRLALLGKTKYRYKSDGLNSLKYKRVAFKQNQLFTSMIFKLP
ncbi:beta-1,4-galactosyltransferase 4-like isoform X1 [Nilaparvata lugens]|uniref:beta-1,4-galactosyltransferase 4-like isoform X1 n=1 Tax=Nilaparvata lugens TaxID=108931 RepID=UPI00193DFA25|nr:beta-1,4-galactosyltransferase 4-like isoform X1 [Nilaparvata lugens]